MTPVKEGEVLAGKFRVERVLGVGGMGVVVSAMHLQLDERVALKFLLPEALGNEEAVMRFAREARAAVKIKSVHVARVSDVGTLETGAPYMVMEFLNGQDLSVLLRERGPMPAIDAVDFVLQASEALAEAHALGIVHRDLKPANLFMIIAADGAPCIKVLDFGISKLTAPDSSGNDYGMTKTHTIMGSPLYMSPEQMTSSRDVDGRADIWAMGTILFELLSGRTPFVGDTMPQLCGIILQEPPPPLRHFRPELPEGLEQVILRCLAKKRDDRFANVGEFAAALAPFGSANAGRSSERISKVLSAAGISSSSLSISGAPHPNAATQSAWGSKSTQARGPGKAIVIGLAVLAAAAVGAAAIFLRHPSEPPGPSAAPPPPAPLPPSPAPQNATAVQAPTVAPAPAAPPTPSENASAAAAPTPAPVNVKTRPGTHSVKTGAKSGGTPKPNAAAPAPTPAPRPAVDPLAGRR